MSNPNNCSKCDHSKYPDGGHCYMFKDAPTYICMQHTERKKLDSDLLLAVLVLDNKTGFKRNWNNSK
ncbi:MAG: hypothetical protein ACD_33C00002G0013 [uncultured bacterium]|nr:MAG: hypothetical protein ACD_33C00002G0013 [uncultured bacterium]